MGLVSCSIWFMLLINMFVKAVPCVLILQCAVMSWKALQKTPDLREPPYPPNLFPGEHLTLIAAATAVPWEVIKAFMGTIIIVKDLDLKKLPKIVILPSIVIEVGIIAWMAVILQMQSTYVPGKCKNAAKWEHTGATKPSIFVALSPHWPVAKKRSPEDICTIFVYKRTVGIIYTVIHSLCAIPCVLALAFFLFIIGAIIFGKCRAAVRLVTGFVPKLFRMFSKPALGEMDSKDVELLSYRPVSDAASKADSVNRSEHLDSTPHFAAVMRNVQTSGLQSLANKALTALEIRKMTCTPGSKSECWGCGNQICEDCKVTEKVDDPCTTIHIEECQSICSSCQLRRSFIPHLFPQFLVALRPCSHRPSKGGKTVEHAHNRDLCSTCANEATEKLLERRAKSERAELINLESDTVICAFCHKNVSWGPRWWVCSICGISCNSKLHAAWVSWKNK